MKTVCILVESMACSGGTQKCAARLARMLVRTGRFRVVLVDSNYDGEPVFFPLDRDVVYLSFRARNTYKRIWQLRRWLKEYRVKTLISVECMLGKISLPATFLTGIERIVWEHGNFFQKQAKDIDRIRRIELFLCKAYIVLTNRDRENFRKGFPLVTSLRKHVLRRIYNTAGSSRPEKRNYDVDSKKIITVGLFRPIKGYDLLVEVAGKVFQRHPDWTWEVYGEIRPTERGYADQVLAKVDEYGLNRNLFFMGKTAHIEKKYAESALLVLTSRMEGLPLVLLEGKQFGLPIVSFDIETGPDEIVQDSLNGYLIPAGNTDLMAERIIELIENPERRLFFSSNSMKNIGPFQEDAVLAEWLKVLSPRTGR